MRIIQLFLSLILLFAGNHVFARMYQWVEPDTGTTQLSGKPPAWYRSATDGPRVLVFEKGRLVDDTDIEVSRDVRRDLRKRAFVMAEEDRQLAKEKLVRARELKDKYVTEEEEQEEFLIPEQFQEEQASAEAVLNELERQKNEQSDEERLAEEEMANKLREMITDWENTKAEEARKQLQ